MRWAGLGWAGLIEAATTSSPWLWWESSRGKRMLNGSDRKRINLQLPNY